jgi:hypothetical protein
VSSGLAAAPNHGSSIKRRSSVQRRRARRRDVHADREDELNGLDPKADLCEVFGRISYHPINRIADLLLWKILRRYVILAA